MTANLMLHTGGRHATYEQVADVITPPATDTFFPVAHVNLIDSVRRFMNEGNWPIAHEEHALSPKNDNYFGLFELDTPDSEYTTIIGLRNSHSMTFSASLCLGSRVFVCDNLAFSAEVKLARKHTRYIMRDLPNLVARAVGMLSQKRIDQDKRFNAYKQIALNGRDGDHAIVELIRADVLNTHTVRDVIKEFDAPRHPEHLTNGERTLWTLFNAVTEVGTKGSNIFNLPRRTNALFGVCDTLGGVIIDQAPMKEAA